MNKNNILISAVVVLMLMSSAPIFIDTVKADDPYVYTWKIECTTKPITRDGDEYFNATIFNDEGSSVTVDIRWYCDGLVRETFYNVELDPGYNFDCPEYYVNWQNDFWWHNVTCEIMYNGAMIDTKDTYFRASPWTIFVFNSYDTSETPELWATNPSYMTNGFSSSHASTTMVGDTELLNGNNCTGSESGSIESVWIRTKGYYSTNKHTIQLQPIFAGYEGDTYEFDDITTTSTWSEWFEITDDPRAPETWTWTDVNLLDCDVIADGDFSAFTLYCSQVEICVYYTD
jgi:hypothetical protein